MADVQGEAAPGFGAIERLAGEEAGHFGVAVHRGERVEVLGADGDEAEARRVEHGSRWVA